MPDNYRNESLDKLFDETRSIITEYHSGIISNDKNKVNEIDEKESRKRINTLSLAKAIVILLHEIMINIQVTKKTDGNIIPMDFNKIYNFGELKDVKEIKKADNDDILSIFEDREFEWMDEFNYESPNSYKLTYDELSVVLNFSYSDYNISGTYYHEGGNFEYDNIDEELLNETLNEDGIVAKLHTQFGVDTSRLQTINTIVLEIHYYRDLEKIRRK